ncbi:mitochondrial 37S ribosomal protein nam9 [Bachmanniomyces sp. S44760]|nr:mitochondrial 37S ribosomal protein nam9 [Bachmanniomyces sp. S44760]
MRKRFLGLKKPKLRSTWNKYNLYNISQFKAPSLSEKTYFQQKWMAKSLTRAYHGETIREKHWQRLFRPTMHSVVPMDHRYLASNDGSEQAEGRGSGLDVDPSIRKRIVLRTPYMNMVYAPTERRLDTAVFRALFACSLRQARQFVVHGYVKVNGKKMIYPGYALNPGDMFQVEPERVLYATGAPKDKKERKLGRVIKKNAKENSDEVGEDASSEAPRSAPTETSAEPAEPEDTRKELKTLLAQAKSVLSDSSSVSLNAKRKQNLRTFRRQIQKTLSRSTKSTTITDSLEAQLIELTAKFNDLSPFTSSSPPETSNLISSEDQPTPAPKTELLTADDRRALEAALVEARENPSDSSKPYATPWRPREYMSAFAFVPRYLEVNHKICSAVYLRHPVARPGLAEVPTPFPDEMNGLAFNWYLRRR